MPTPCPKPEPYRWKVGEVPAVAVAPERVDAPAAAEPATRQAASVAARRTIRALTGAFRIGSRRDRAQSCVRALPAGPGGGPRAGGGARRRGRDRIPPSSPWGRRSRLDGGGVATLAHPLQEVQE